MMVGFVAATGLAATACFFAARQGSTGGDCAGCFLFVILVETGVA